MVPRRKISAIDVATPLAEVLSLVTGDGHSRYPVFRENLDNVVGLLYVKDLFALVRDREARVVGAAADRAAPVLFVTESQPAASVLKGCAAGASTWRS